MSRFAKLYWPNCYIILGEIKKNRYLPMVSNNVNTRYKPENCDRKLKLVKRPGK